MTAQEKRIQLKKILLADGCTPVPGVYDALGAKLTQAAGFEAAYLGSYATAVSVVGQPDVGSVTLTEMATHAKNISSALTIPLIVDAENGFAHAANIWRTVNELEIAGASAIHIEDHEFGKHTKLPPVILDTDKMCRKIEAAVAARSDDNFIIIARTDTAWAMKSVEEMIKRANAYLGAGADAVFLAFDASYVTREMRDAVKGPVIMPGSHLSTVAQESEKGINLSLYWPMLVNTAFVAMRESLKLFKESGDINSIGKYNIPESEINEYIGYDDFLKRADKYLR